MPAVEVAFKVVEVVMHLYVCHFCGLEHSDKYGHAAVCAPNPTIASILRQRHKEMPRDVRVAAVEALIGW